ncbi:uncharacterized protein [Venturia canescens]|uniref:uncharacterized protein n=1 Tax=Venturia canescens TaxID=32260 RepID=UPI001C9D5116|nr:uncharacterized protein LOC122418385 [Venturia canescens]
MAPERFVRIVQIFGRLTLIWPPEPQASYFEKWVTNGAWYAAALLNVLSIFLTIRQLGNIDNDPVFLTRTLTILVIVGDSFFHLVLVRLQWQRFEILVHEVTDFLKAAKTYEKLVCRKYVRRYLGHHTFLVLTFLAGIAAFFIERYVTKTEFPLDNLYSSSNDTDINRICVRTLQYFMILEPMCLLSGDFMIIMLLWYCSARLELLGESMHHVHDPIELRKCARRHENIISFVKETNLAIDLIILKSLTAVSVVILCAALQLSHRSKWPTLSQFFLIICVASVRLFGCAWAGDDLTEMASRLSWSIYQCPAIFRSLSLSRSASIIIQTSKRSLVVTVLGRNLVLSLRFFSRYSIKVVSFFMTLRACIERYVRA